jgi:hypothetical protein
MTSSRFLLSTAALLLLATRAWNQTVVPERGSARDSGDFPAIHAHVAYRIQSSLRLDDPTAGEHEIILFKRRVAAGTRIGRERKQAFALRAGCYMHEITLRKPGYPAFAYT